MDLFISKEILDALSYKASFRQSIKQISLRETPLSLTMEHIAKYRSSYVDANGSSVVKKLIALAELIVRQSMSHIKLIQ